MKPKKTWFGSYEWAYRLRFAVGKGDAWGFAIELYPCDNSMTFHFIRWYLIIELWREQDGN